MIYQVLEGNRNILEIANKWRAKKCSIKMVRRSCPGRY